jgi:hypothetical protein
MIDRVQSMESSAAKTPDIPLQNPFSKHYISSILPAEIAIEEINHS